MLCYPSWFACYFQIALKSQIDKNWQKSGDFPGLRPSTPPGLAVLGPCMCWLCLLHIVWNNIFKLLSDCQKLTKIRKTFRGFAPRPHAQNPGWLLWLGLNIFLNFSLLLSFLEDCWMGKLLIILIWSRYQHRLLQHRGTHNRFRTFLILNKNFSVLSSNNWQVTWLDHVTIWSPHFEICSYTPVLRYPTKWNCDMRRVGRTCFMKPC